MMVTKKKDNWKPELRFIMMQNIFLMCKEAKQLQKAMYTIQQEIRFFNNAESQKIKKNTQ